MKWLIMSIMLAQNVDPLVLEQKSLEAREILQQNPVKYRVRNGRIIAREILIAVYNSLLDSIGLARIEVPVPSAKPFSFNLLTPDFLVEHISGSQIIRLRFNIFDQDANIQLIALDSRHIHTERQRREARDLFYRPYSDIFQEDYFTQKGWSFYKSIVRESQEELCATGAKSRAYPEKLLCEVFPDHLLLTLGAIEQMDDGEFFADPDYSVKKFLAHVARNGADAFFYSTSVEGARGLMQFMNSKKIGTYDLVRKKYPEVNLISDFEKGTADMKNSIKAAICLADMNLEELPQNARDRFETDWFLGGIFVATAHNGGSGRALRLWREFEKGLIDFDDFKPKKGLLPKETENFIKKYIAVWKILESR